jgi:hypothetical protein
MWFTDQDGSRTLLGDPGTPAIGRIGTSGSRPRGGGDSSSGGSSGSFSGGSSGGSATAGISSAEIAALLAGQLTPSGKAARIGALLKSGGFGVMFNALEAGTAVID